MTETITCHSGPDLPEDRPILQDRKVAALDERVARIVADLSLDEKLAMMAGSGSYVDHSRAETWGGAPYPAGSGCERLGIPPLMFADGPRGVILGRSTCFPCTMARGASFDRELEHRIGEAMAKEARAQGCNMLGAVCVNVLRHPGWGRAQETYGEDTWHLGEMGTALTQGIQKHNVMATVKHFALNSMENARFKVDVRVDDRALYEVYLPQFRKVIKAGCKTVMSAYNKVNGDYCGQNHRLLTEVLRTEWGFDGFVHSDWVLGVYGPEGAVAGLDIENPEPAWFGAPLRQAVASGDIEEGVIDRAVTRILRTQLATLEAKDPQPAYPETLVACDAHRALALEAAEKSAVLLTNRQCLPLDASEVSRIGIFGTLATLENTGDQGSSRVSAPYVVTPYEGIARYLGEERIFLGGDERDPEAAAKAAAGIDAAVVVVGYTAADEGEFIPDDIDLGQTALPQSLQDVINQNAERRSGLELGGDRRSLGLHADQVALVEAVASVVPKTVVVVVAGSAVLMADWCEKPAAVMQTFYAGMEGGSALARLLFGDVSPSGKLPFSVAQDASHYPPFDIDATRIRYDLWHGYRLLDRAGHTPLFPFGFGLSYSRFVYDQLEVRQEDDGALRASVVVRNVGDMRAAEVVQLYLSPPGKAAPRPEKSLCGFERVELDEGVSATVQFSVPLEDAAWFDATTKCWRVEEGKHALFVGGSSHTALANAAYIHLNDRFL